MKERNERDEIARWNLIDSKGHFLGGYLQTQESVVEVQPCCKQTLTKAPFSAIDSGQVRALMASIALPRSFHSGQTFSSTGEVSLADSSLTTT